jgi:hypothetical protein
MSEATKTKRQQGYVVKTETFVPLTGNLKEDAATLAALEKVQTGDLDPLGGLETKVDVKATSRQVPA